MKIDIKKIAELADLKLKEKNIPTLEKQLNDVISYVEKLNTVETHGVDITSQVTGLENVTREDKPGQSLTQEEALSGTESKHNGLFKVGAILED
jgi:aspartyl-tRNA(Asn)/glutamyl-tRNA(Gln) amidotransferase subunit C